MRTDFTWRNVPGFFDFHDLYDSIASLYEYASRPVKFVEVGSWLGRSAFYLFDRILQGEIRFAQLHIVDSWQYPVTVANRPHMTDYVNKHGGNVKDAFLYGLKECGYEKFLEKNLFIHQIDSVKGAELFKDGELDFCFIDADHSYESVKNDILAWKPKVRSSGGIIAGHDYDLSWPELNGVIQAVDELLPDAEEDSQVCWRYMIPYEAKESKSGRE